MTGVHALARICILSRGAAAVLAVLLCATPAHAQSEEGVVTTGLPTRLRIVLGAEAGLHSVDMVTTVRNLQFGGGAVREANPLLAPFSGRPAALVAVSSAVNLLQIYTIAKLHPRHPKVATAWALILAGAEAYAVANNVRVARQLNRAVAGR